MRAALTDVDFGLRLAEVEPATVKAGQVAVSVVYCGICGSDLHFRSALPVGTVMGHEVVGRVAQVAPDVDAWKPGDRVVILPYEPCGHCPQCSASRPNICEQRRFGIGGSHAPGGYAETVIVPSTMLVALPDTLDDRDAALVEPLAVALHGLAIGGAHGQPALVVGGGTIGLLVALALKAVGTERLVVAETRQDRRDMLSRAGITAVSAADETVVEHLGGRPTLIFECAGYPNAVTDCLRIIAPRGELVLLAASGEASLPQWTMMMKEARISSALFYTREEFEAAVAMLDDGRVPGELVPTTVVPLDEAPAAFDQLLKREAGHLKVLLQP